MTGSEVLLLIKKIRLRAVPTLPMRSRTTGRRRSLASSRGCLRHLLAKRGGPHCCGTRQRREPLKPRHRRRSMEQFPIHCICRFRKEDAIHTSLGSRNNILNRTKFQIWLVARRIVFTVVFCCVDATQFTSPRWLIGNALMDHEASCSAQAAMPVHNATSSFDTRLRRAPSVVLQWTCRVHWWTRKTNRRGRKYY